MKRSKVVADVVSAIVNVPVVADVVSAVADVVSFTRDDARIFLATFSDIPETVLNRFAKIPEDSATFRFLLLCMAEMQNRKTVRGDAARDIVRATLQRENLFFSSEKKETTWNRGLMRNDGTVNPATVYSILGKVVLQKKTATGNKLEQSVVNATDAGVETK